VAYLMPLVLFLDTLRADETVKAHSVFWQNALANFLGSFLGSVLAAALLWLVVTWLYELPKSKREKRELLAMSYGLIQRELEAAAAYCEEMGNRKPTQISVALPITQAWETLHSTEAFRYIPPRISEKLVKCYSLLFRLRKDVELEHMFLFGEKLPMTDPNSYGQLRQGTHKLSLEVAAEVVKMVEDLRKLLGEEILKMTAREKQVFDEAYEIRPN